MMIAKKVLFTFSLSALALGNISTKPFDEGMFPLSEVSKLDLQKAGLKIPQKEIYNPDSTSLIDALVNVGGCTGSFVSENGLIITNHHCAFSAVQLASTAENDYLTHGFVANKPEQEIEAKGLTCRITDSYENVSEEILTAVSGVDDVSQRQKIIQEKIRIIEARTEATDKSIDAEVSEMFIGKSYVLFKYKIIKDVRLVYVPKQNVGEFGGETDNWVWPRHTGDFSFMRAYVAPDGSAASYAKENVPYKPKKHLKINANGVKDGDFTFMLGYPGRTFRHRPAQFISYQQNYQLPYTADLYEFQNKTMEEVGKDKGRTTELKLATRIKRNANVLKNYRGKLKGLNNIELVKQKQEEDNQLVSYINQNADLKKLYGNLMYEIDDIYKQINNSAYQELWYAQVYGSSNLLRVAAQINTFKEALLKQPLDKRETFYNANLPRLEKAISNLYDSYDLDVDKKLLNNMLERAYKLPLNQKIAVIDKNTRGFNSSEQAQKFINNLFAYSRLNNENFTKTLIKDMKQLVVYQDPFLSFEQELSKEIALKKLTQDKREAKLSKLMADYVTVKEQYLQKNFIPDANSTLRLTYGHIKGFSPVDGSYMLPFTSIKGIIEKGRSGNVDYQYPEQIKTLWEQKDFGPFKMAELNDVPVCFLYDMDTTGGNSGSPVLNAYGELIGVNFDRAYEATINDYAWNENYSRSIGVDIRYVLWVASKIDKASGVLKELGV